MMSGMTETFNSMTGLLNTNYEDGYMMSSQQGYIMDSYPPQSPGYCSLSPSDGYPMYAALQAANDSPPQYQHFHAEPQKTAELKRSRTESFESDDTKVSNEEEDSNHSNHSNSGNKDLSYNENVSQWLNQQACGGVVKRKRRVNRNQRLAANKRERKRMGTFNEAFERLRESIHCGGQGNKRKKMSRIQTLKTAIQYISDLTKVLNQTESQYQPQGQVSERQIDCW